MFQTNDLAPAGDALTDDRALDPDRDGSKESGGDFWTSYIMHTRDVVRQSALDHFAMIRILRSFDGERLAGPVDHDGDGVADERWDYEDWEDDTDHPDENRLVGDFDGDGTVELAGDFNADGVVDMGGPDGKYYVWGQSLGGIMSALMGGLDPSIRAIAPTSGGGGLSDIAVRDDNGGVRRAVVLRIMSPLIVTAPVSETMVDDHDTACEAGQVSTRFMIPDVNDDTRVEFACLDPVIATEGNVLVAENLDNGEMKCAMFRPGGLVRISLPSDQGNRIRLSIFAQGDVPRTDTCEPLTGADPVHVVDTFEVDAVYQFLSWTSGETLVAPTEGYGIDRNTPEMRRLLSLAQIALEAGDPINYAPHYYLEPIEYPGLGEHHTNALVIGTAGDRVVPINTAAAQMRAAGILDFSNVDPRYGKTPNQLLVDNWVLEGVEQYGRSYPDDASGRCDTDPCPILFDPDDLDLDTDGYESPYPADPLRLWRPSVPDDLLASALLDCDVETVNEGGRTWVEKVTCPDGVSAGLFPIIFPDGEHGFYIPDPALVFDINTYLVNQIALYFSTDGTELSFALCQHDSSCPWIAPLPPRPDGWPVIGD